MPSSRILRILMILWLCLGCAGSSKRAAQTTGASRPTSATTGSVRPVTPEGRHQFRLGTAVVYVDVPATWHVVRSEADHLTLVKFAKPGAEPNPTIEVFTEPKREQCDAPALTEAQAQRVLGHLGSPVEVPYNWSNGELGSNGLAGAAHWLWAVGNSTYDGTTTMRRRTLNIS
jgi:hypothetical protein